MTSEDVKTDMKELPNYGDLMSIETFKEAVKDGMFIDYDGFGYLASNTQISNIVVKPSYISEIGL